MFEVPKMLRFTRFFRGKIWCVDIGPCKRFDIFHVCITIVTITCAFQSLVLDAWEKEQKELEEQRLWKLIYRWDNFKSVDPTTYICIYIYDTHTKCHNLIYARSPPLYYLPSGPLNPSEERVFVFCYQKL